MANEARSSNKVKDNENNNSKEVAGKPSTGSGAETSKAFGLRRSVRETPSKKNMSPSPSSIRKSERLEKRTPTPPSMRKSERVEKQILPSSLRRSERGKKQSSSSSSGSKKSNKSLGLSVIKKKLKKVKCVKQLTLETDEISKSQKRITEPVQVVKKRMDARAYRALFKQQPKKVNAAGHSKERNKDDKLSLECINYEGAASKSVDKDKEYGQKKVQDLREVFAGRDSEKTLEESDHSVSKPPILENNPGLESSLSSQNCGSVREAPRSEDGDSVEDSKGGDDALFSAHKTMSRKLDVVAEMKKKKLHSELVNPMMSEGASNNDVESESAYKEISLKRKRNKVDIDSDATAMASRKDICPSAAGASLPERANGADVTTRLTEKCFINLQHRDSPADFQLDGGQNTCLVCKLGGKLLCCEGRGCKRSYHLHCLDPPLKDVPLGVWYCLSCVRKKIKLGAPSVSEGIESIWQQLESEENGLQKKDLFVKYKGLAHVHNRWVSESQLLLEAPSLVAKFNRKNQVSKWKQEWIEPQRMLQKRLLDSPKQLDEVRGGDVGDDLDCRCEWLVKWQGLDYKQASWELETASFMKSPNTQKLMRDYENRLERAKKGHCLSRIYKELEMEKGSVKSNHMSTGGIIEFDNNHLDFVNNLRGQWHKGQNVIVIDDQERIMKVITFITSFSSNECWPFLIITSSAAFYSWDEEFFRLAPSIDAVVYHGCKDARREIRTVEFYVEGDAVMFDVLITSPEVIAEDLDFLDSIKWEAVIVDECQRSRIYSHSEQINSLNTEMRLLLFNGQLKDGIIEHLLSLLDCEGDITGSEGFVTNSDHRISNLKEKLSKYIVNGSKSETSRFVEYWVPVQISNAQLEQYCANLLSNSLLLCSSSKNDLVGALRDIIISNRKCCDHPYIMDPLLPKSLTEDFKVANALDVDIKASGKLRLLNAMLFEIRNRGLRVLILFQSSGGSGKDKIGDILDDFLRLRFGKDSYERVDGLVSPAKKIASLNNFKNQKSRFVFLLETRACLPSIKLSSVDTVIIYSSDWNPANDLRSLQKITLDTQFEQLRIFRLYSSFTVEENVLILAKQDKTLDSNLQGISRATSQSLLMCGASYLFKKLDEFHSGCSLVTCRSTSFESLSHEDIVQEFLTILPQNAKDNNSSNLSIILKAKQNQGNYGTDFPLPGEKKIQLSDADVPCIFWKKLLDRKQPRWKYSSCLSQRNRKRVQHFNDVLKKPESEGVEVAKKRKKVANNDDVRTSTKSALFEGNIDSAENEGDFGAASHNVHRLSGSTSHLNSSHTNNTLTSSILVNNKPEVPTVNLAKSSERTNLRDSQKGLHVLLKPEIAKLCEILQLPEDVKAMAQSFLEYVMNNHFVIREPVTILQAFHISLCWMAASLLKYKLGHKESVALAKQHLNFGCKKEEADYVYSMLRCLKKMFLYLKRRCTPACSLKTSESSMGVANKDHHVKSSLSTPSSLQKVKVELEDLAHGQESFDDQVLLQLGQQDFSRSIKDIQKKCDKQMRKLLQKQQEEIEECKRKYGNEKAELEKKQKTEAAVIRLHSNSSMRTDKLKLLDIEYEKKFEELKHQMEIRCKELEEMHMAARKKLEERKEKWVNGVISWANMGLINKPASNETGNSHRNAQSLNSHLKKQNFENIIEDGEVPVVVSVSSSDDVENTVKLSSNEQSSNEATSTVPNKKFPMELPENANSTGGSENLREPETALPKTMDDGIAITGENDFGPAMPTDDAIQLNQQNGVMCILNQDAYSIMTAGSQAAKSASNKVVEDGKVVEDKTIDNGISDSSEKTTGVGQQEEETLSGVPEIAEVEGGESREQQGVEAPSRVPETAAGEVKGNETSKQQDGKVQAVEKVGNQGSESLGEPARVSQQGMDLPQTDGEAVEDASTGREINGVGVMASNVDNHLQELSGALQEQCLQQTTSTGLQQVEPSVPHQDHDVTSNQTTDERVLQMPSIDSSFIPNAMDLPSSSETDHTTIGIAESSMEMEDQTEHSSRAVSQPVTPLLQHLPAETPIGGSGMHVLDTRSVSTSSGVNNHAVQTAPPVRVPPLPLCHDPLQNELERIRKETDQIITIHEDTKLRLKSECEKEIEEVVAEIRRKYESKYQAMELEFLLKKKELDTNHSKVLMNKILAEAFRSKCMDIKASSSPDMRQDVPSSFMQQLLQLSSQPPAQRNTIVSGLSSAGPVAGGPQIVIPSSHSTAPSIHSTATVSGNLTRPPVINSIHPAGGNLQMACGIRAPAPHLQPFRSAASAMVTNTSSLTVGTASQPVPGSLPTTSAAPSQLQLQPQPSTHQSEASGIMPPLPSSSTSLLELLMAVDNQRNSDSPHSNPRNLHSDSNTETVILSELGPQNDTRTTVTSQNEVVCLSDDD